MITITGLTEDKYQELVQKAKEHLYRYASSTVIYNEVTHGYDVTFSSEISAYITTSYDNRISVIHLLSLGQHFITLKASDYIRLSVV